MKRKLKALTRLYSIYCELGYVPWHKARKPRKERRARKKGNGVYMGTREAIIPFLNDDSKRTFSQLLLRPGYLMRDYILRGKHESYLAPLTALLVFYSVFTLVLAIVKPSDFKDPVGDRLIEREHLKVDIQLDSIDVAKRRDRVAQSFLTMFKSAFIITKLALHPGLADTAWKKSLAAIEGDLRSKGIPLFLGRFLLLWLLFALCLRKYKISVSGAAAMSAYVLCQFCIFMFLSLLISFGKDYELPIWVMCALLIIDYMQLFGISFKQSVKLTLKTALYYVLYAGLFYLLLGIILFLAAVLFGS